MKKPKKIRTDTLAAIEALPEADQARLAVELTADMRRIRREAYVKLKETRSFAEVGKMFGISGTRVDQIIRGSAPQQVHHRDGNPRNNDVDNLELRDQPDA